MRAGLLQMTQLGTRGQVETLASWLQTPPLTVIGNQR